MPPYQVCLERWQTGKGMAYCANSTAPWRLARTLLAHAGPARRPPAGLLDTGERQLATALCCDWGSTCEPRALRSAFVAGACLRG